MQCRSWAWWVNRTICMKKSGNLRLPPTVFVFLRQSSSSFDSLRLPSTGFILSDNLRLSPIVFVSGKTSKQHTKPELHGQLLFHAHPHWLGHSTASPQMLHTFPTLSSRDEVSRFISAVNSSGMYALVAQLGLFELKLFKLGAKPHWKK